MLLAVRRDDLVRFFAYDPNDHQDRLEPPVLENHDLSLSIATFSIPLASLGLSPGEAVSAPGGQGRPLPPSTHFFVAERGRDDWVWRNDVPIDPALESFALPEESINCPTFESQGLIIDTARARPLFVWPLADRLALIGTAAGEIVRVRPDHFESLSIDPPATKATSIAQGPDGRLWFATHLDGALRLTEGTLDGSTVHFRFVSTSTPGLARGLGVEDPTRGGRLIVLTESGRLLSFANDRFTALSSELGMPQVAWLDGDAEGTWWATLRGSSIAFRLFESQVVPIDLPSTAFSLGHTPTAGTLVGVRGGIVRIVENTAETFQNFSDDEVTNGIISWSGGFVAGTAGGQLRFFTENSICPSQTVLGTLDDITVFPVGNGFLVLHLRDSGRSSPVLLSYAFVEGYF